jgi:AICAR transformylase/IMP cyclohydrolase PurH
VLNRITDLYKEVLIIPQLTPDQIEELEALDKLRLNNILTAEKNCRKLRMGKVAWSPQFQASTRRI